MAAGTFDAILNWLIPLLLILIIGGFVYTKLIGPYVTPHLIRFWEYLTTRKEENKMPKEIIYE